MSKWQKKKRESRIQFDFFHPDFRCLCPLASLTSEATSPSCVFWPISGNSTLELQRNLRNCPGGKRRGGRVEGPTALVSRSLPSSSRIHCETGTGPNRAQALWEGQLDLNSCLHCLNQKTIHAIKCLYSGRLVPHLGKKKRRQKTFNCAEIEKREDITMRIQMAGSPALWGSGGECASCLSQPAILGIPGCEAPSLLSVLT